MSMLGIRPIKQKLKTAKRKHSFKKRIGAAVVAGIFTTVFVTAINMDENVTKARAAFLDLYTIQKGDTLFGLAQKFNSSVEDLKKVNHLESDLIITGQKLIIPPLVQPSGAKTESKVAPEKQKQKSKQTYNQHTVKQGETIFSISNQFKVSMDALIEANGIKDNHIIVGQKLSIPYSKYTVKINDTLHSIAKQNGISVDQLKVRNKLTSNTIKVGQILSVPNHASHRVTKASPFISTKASTKASTKQIEATESEPTSLPIVSLELVNALATVNN
jgi:LysM repeat protein